MKKIKKLAMLFISILLLTGCGNSKYKVEEEVTLNGTIKNKQVIVDGQIKEISVLELEEPITIGDKKFHQIELISDKKLKDQSEVSIKGVIKDGNKASVLDLDYLFDVNDIDNVLSYVNTFSNEYFSLTIPSSLMKLCTVTEIDNGFIVYSTNNMDVGGEVFRVLSVTSKEFRELQNDDSVLIEKISSDKEKTIIIEYPKTTEYKDEYADEYESIVNQINTIKNNIKIK